VTLALSVEIMIPKSSPVPEHQGTVQRIDACRGFGFGSGSPSLGCSPYVFFFPFCFIVFVRLFSPFSDLTVFNFQNSRKAISSSDGTLK